MPKKNRGYLQRLPVDSRRLKSNQYKMMKYGVSDRQSALIFNMQETTDSRDEENLTMIQELDPTHLWKKMIEEQKEELSYTDKIRRNIKIYETLLAILAFISIIISIVEYEAKYYKAYFKDRYEIPNYQYYQKEALEKILDENYDGNPFRVILSILSLFMVWFSYLSNKNSYILKYEEKKVNETYFWRSSFFTKFLIEMFIDLIHPIPYIDAEYTFTLLGKSITYRAMTFLYSFIFLKIYYIYKIFGIYSRYSNKLSERYCENYGCEASNLFALKCDLKENPFFMLMFTLINVGLVFGILVRFFEVLDLDNKDNFIGFSNGVWLIFIALTTVGYGEIYPKTHVGRIIVLMGVWMGTFLISVTIVAFTNLSTFSKDEHRSFTILKRYLVRIQLKKVAAKLIGNNFKKILVLRKQSNFTDDTSEYRELKTLFFTLKRERNELVIALTELIRQLNSEYFKNEDDKFIDLESQLDSSLKIIKSNISALKKYYDQLNKQISTQKVIMLKQDLFIDEVKAMKMRYLSLLQKLPRDSISNRLKLHNQYLNSIDNNKSISYINPSNDLNINSNTSRVEFNNLKHKLFKNDEKNESNLFNVSHNILGQSNAFLLDKNRGLGLKNINDNIFTIKKEPVFIGNMEKFKDDPFVEDSSYIFLNVIQRRDDGIIDTDIDERISNIVNREIKRNKVLYGSLYNWVSNSSENNMHKNSAVSYAMLNALSAKVRNARMMNDNENAPHQNSINNISRNNNNYSKKLY